MKKIMVIGYGAMAKNVLVNLPSDISLGYLLVRPEKVAIIQKEVGDSVQVIGSVAELNGQPDMVVEMAGQAGLKQHIFAVLEKGLNIGVISAGAFADAEFEAKVKLTAQKYNSQVHVLAGAVAGIDGLASAKVAGLTEVIYQGRKPPKGWKGSPADNLVDLDVLTEPTVFFKGSAREAAAMFPQNANVAATIALAGTGMDDTIVELIADPTIDRNQHYMVARGTFGQMSMTMQGVTLPDNPKTSMLAALSVTRFCRNLSDGIIL